MMILENCRVFNELISMLTTVDDFVFDFYQSHELKASGLFLQ